LVPVLVSLAWKENRALQISSGWSHTCALREDRSVWCWGRNESLQLGHESNSEPTGLRRVSFPAQAEAIVQVGSGEYHVCARDRRGRVFCWGDNSYGQVNQTPGAAKAWALPQLVVLPTPAVDLGAGSRHSCALLIDGSVWCWGSNLQGTLGAAVSSPSAPVRVRFAGDPKIMELAVGEAHSCIRREDGRVHCWGADEVARGGSSLEIAKQLPW
jgi:alpha-tubulin suppressor-like RCC1 family protein